LDFGCSTESLDTSDLKLVKTSDAREWEYYSDSATYSRYTSASTNFKRKGQDNN